MTRRPVESTTSHQVISASSRAEISYILAVWDSITWGDHPHGEWRDTQKSPKCLLFIVKIFEPINIKIKGLRSTDQLPTFRLERD